MNRNTVFRATIDKYLKPIEDFRRDDTVTEIMINGPSEIYIERAGMLQRTEAKFDDPDCLFAVARNIAQYTSKRISESTARFDSRLPDGSRVHIVMPRCGRKLKEDAQREEVLFISIRKFPAKGRTLEGLVNIGSVTEEAREYVEVIVELEKNMIVSGGTGSGKTSFLNACSLKIPSTERIIVLEDTSELQLQQPHVLYFETAPPDRYGRGAVAIRDLFHSALRMRPDRIVIGECRGGEALDMIQAMTSGHGGSMSTLHANNSGDALNRLETMALMAGVDIPLNALRSQVSSAIDVVIQLMRLPDGRRLVTEIGEVGKRLTPENQYQVNPVFALREGVAGGGPASVRLYPTGNRSIFAEDVSARGLASSVIRNGSIFNV
jgi:pilus assembly protein CpaF